MYVRGAGVVIYTVDLSQDLASQKSYLEDQHADKGALTYLVGMKVDVDQSHRLIFSTDLKGLGTELGITQIFECSAKTGDQVKELVSAMVKAVKANPHLAMRNQDEVEEPPQQTETDALVPKHKKPCWAWLCCGWGSGSDKKAGVDLAESEKEENGVTYTRLEK